MLTEKEVATLLARYVDENFTTRTSASRFFQVTPQFLSAVIKGRKRPNKPMLEALGLEKVVDRQVYYEKVPQNVESPSRLAEDEPSNDSDGGI